MHHWAQGVTVATQTDDKHRQRGESAGGRGGGPGLLYSVGYWVFSKKHHIAGLHRHSHLKHSFWKTFLVPGVSSDFQSSENGKLCQCKGWVAVRAKSTAEEHPKVDIPTPLHPFFIVQMNLMNVTFLGWVCFGVWPLTDYEPVESRQAYMEAETLHCTARYRLRAEVKCKIPTRWPTAKP